MYRVFIVDDEPIAIMGIKMTFEWENYGFTIVGDTTDACMAVDMAEKLKPDVIFTDIVMPDMTGLELIKKIKQRQIDSEFVIISGHNDFMFTRQAIQQGIFDYCLKPIKKIDADELLDRLKEHLDKKNNVYYEDDGLVRVRNTKLQKIIEYIDNNYADGIKLSKIAEKFEINSNYLSTLFKREMGLGFSQYLVEVKLKKAEIYLKETEMSIEEIADKIGMEYYYFLKLFKKRYKTTPSHFREKFAK